MMRAAKRSVWVAGLLATVGLTGCSGLSPFEYISGGTGAVTTLSDQASVTVLTPAGNLSILGGTQVEVNWQAIAKSRFSTLDVIVDLDETPDNGNEIIAFSNLTLTETTVLVDTTRLLQGTYHIGVVMREVGQIVAFGYAPGAVTIDQRPQLFFTDAKTQGALTVRDNYFFDRTQRIDPTFEIDWQLVDPDSINTVELLLDPDDAPNGNEVSLYKSSPQPLGTSTGTFTFDLPTATFSAGTYRILAAVSDGQNSTYFYAPGTIHLRARRAGYVDLRDINLPTSGLNGAAFEGVNPRDNLGSFVSSAEDIDSDGFSDLMLVAQFGKPAYVVNLQRVGVGEAYLIYGRPQRFSGVLNVNSTGTLFRGDVYRGVEEVADPIRPTRGITSFTVLTDWDGDNVREFAFGVPFSDSFPAGFLDQGGYFRTGAVVVASSTSLGTFTGQHVLWLGWFGSMSVPIPGTPTDCLEGFVGPKAPSVNSGWTLYYLHLGLMVDPAHMGCRISTTGFGDQCGETISSYPFFDGATANLAATGGAPDLSALVISAPGRDPITNTRSVSLPGAGVVSVYFRPRGFNPWDNTATQIPHRGPYLYVVDDSQWSPGYIVTTDADPCPRVLIIDPPIPERTARFYGGFAGASVGNAVATDDFNADGIPDLLIGSPLSNGGRGAAFLVLGRLEGLVLGSELALEELGLPMNGDSPQHSRVFDGIRVLGAPGDRLGQAQASAGDFNGDGISDVVIGSPLVNGRRGGAAVFLGSRDAINLTQNEIPFDEIASRGLGVIFEGEQDGDLAGARVAGVGDIDGDGNDDVLIAAPNRSVHLDLNGDGKVEIDRINCGVVYLVYGSPDLKNKRSQRQDGSFTEPGRLLLSDIGTENVPGAVFIGRNPSDFLGAGLGEQGDRTRGVAGAGDVDNDGFKDILIGSVSASPRNRERAGEVYLLYGVGEPRP